eukprot:6155795-Amphidinium_carterae.1
MVGCFSDIPSVATCMCDFNEGKHLEQQPGNSISTVETPPNEVNKERSDEDDNTDKHEGNQPSSNTTIQ